MKNTSSIWTLLSGILLLSIGSILLALNDLNPGTLRPRYADLISNQGIHHRYPMREGIASWYGERFAGRPTANGEIFDPAGWTAAHRTLPLGTMVKVTNPRNGTSIMLRVNDRGPYISGRIIDLSQQAARMLDLEEQGIGEVQIEVLSYPPSRSPDQHNP